MPSSSSPEGETNPFAKREYNHYAEWSLDEIHRTLDTRFRIRRRASEDIRGINETIEEMTTELVRRLRATQ